MMPTPWFPDAVRLLDYNPQVNVGLHLTLTSEWERMKWRPLSNTPSITCDDGYFLPGIRLTIPLRSAPLAISAMKMWRPTVKE